MIADSNLTRSFAPIDFACQTRTTLHLHRALHERQMVPRIELLDFVDNALASGHCVWHGGKSSGNGHVEHFLLSLGSGVQLGKRIRSFLKTEFLNHKKTQKIDTEAQNLRDWMETVEMLDMFSTMNRRVRATTANGVSSLVKHFLSRNFDLPNGQFDCLKLCSLEGKVPQDKVEAEHRLLSVNWLKVSVAVLHRFLEDLCDCLGLILACLEKDVQNDDETPEHCHCVFRRRSAKKRNLCFGALASTVFCELEWEEKTERPLFTQGGRVHEPTLCHNRSKK